MRKNLVGYRVHCFESALETRGYRRISHFKNEWRKRGYHVILHLSKGKIVLHIHSDPRFHIGRSRVIGEDLEREVKEILKAYKKITPLH